MNNNNVNNNNSNSNKCAKNSYYDFVNKQLITFKTKNMSEGEKEDLIFEYSEGLKDFSISVLIEAFEIMRIKSKWFPDLGTLKNIAYERALLRAEEENPDIVNKFKTNRR